MCRALKNPTNGLTGPEKPLEHTPKSRLCIAVWVPIHLPGQHRHLEAGGSGLPTEVGPKESQDSGPQPHTGRK